MVERERRAHPRKLVSTGVSFNDLEGATLRGWLHDISRGGCFVATPSIFTFGEELTIVLTLPFPRQRVQGRVRVAWVREKNDKDMPAGMGLEFVEVNEDALVAIDKLAATPKFSRPKTVIGIAPPAVGSSPSYSDVKIPLPTPEDLANGPPGLDAGMTEPEGVPIVQLPEPTPAPTEPTKPPTMEPAPPEPAPLELLPPALGGPPPEEPKKSGREKLLIGGAAAVSVAGLAALIVVYTHRGAGTPAVDAATSASTVAIVDAAPAVVDATVPAEPVVTPPPPPIVDAAVEAAARDGGHHDAGADAGKKKPVKPKVKRR